MLVPSMGQHWGQRWRYQQQACQQDGEDDVGYGRSRHGSFAADLRLGGRFGACRED